jgi:uncharacterized protein YndB with AHSA1/START domain
MKNDTKVERKSDLELVITRTFNGPAHIVFDAWTKPELLKRWWTPRSIDMSFVTCEIDARTGGKYRFVFKAAGFEQPMAFHGRYIEVVPNARLVWTNEEGDDGGAVTTVTFEEKSGRTLVTMHDRYPTKEALEEAISGSAAGFMETFDQLEELLAALP